MTTNQILLGEISPRSVRYLCNGTGRDTYIDFNSGGFLKNVVNTQKQRDTQGNYFNFRLDYFDKQIADFLGHFSFHLQQRRKIEVVPAKSIHYNSNGSGRDGYIKYNDGGLMSPLKKQNSFFDTLRSYEKINDILKDDIFKYYQQQLSPRESLKQTLLQQQQTKMTQRLSVPKRKQERYTKPDLRLPRLDNKHYLQNSQIFNQKITEQNEDEIQQKTILKNKSLPILGIKYGNLATIE